MASAIVLSYPDRAGAVGLVALLRERGMTAVAVPEEDDGVRSGMVWRVRVPEDQAAQARSLVRVMARRP